MSKEQDHRDFIRMGQAMEFSQPFPRGQFKVSSWEPTAVAAGLLFCSVMAQAIWSWPCEPTALAVCLFSVSADWVGWLGWFLSLGR